MHHKNDELLQLQSNQHILTAHCDDDNHDHNITIKWAHSGDTLWWWPPLSKHYTQISTFSTIIITIHSPHTPVHVAAIQTPSNFEILLSLSSQNPHAIRSHNKHPHRNIVASLRADLKTISKRINWHIPRECHVRITQNLLSWRRAIFKCTAYGGIQAPYAHKVLQNLQQCIFVACEYKASFKGMQNKEA